MKMRHVLVGLSALAVVLPLGEAGAADKNGVSPQVISLPSGPGSIQGLGESYQPQLNSGAGTYSVPIRLPGGPGGIRPSLTLEYHTANGNGPLGMGWKLSGLTMVSRNMDAGLPMYVDEANGLDDDFDGVIDNPQEIDRFSGIDLEELVALPDATFRSESENTFLRYERAGDGWRARTRSGLLHEFGTTSPARIENNGRAFAWLLDRTTDLNGNTIEYRYLSDPSSPGQKYCREIRWSQGPAFYAVVLTYETDRPDVHTDFRSGFEVRTGLRLSRIDVIAQGVPNSPGALIGDLNEDGETDILVRRYVLEYAADTLQSLLSRVTLFGSDGVTAMPSLTFAYTQWDAPDDVAVSMIRSSGDPAAALDSEDVELIDMNNDGLPDLLNATTSAHRAHLNLGINTLGRLAWDTVGTTVLNAPGLNLGSTAVHLADHTADGESDLVHKVNDSTFQCFVNSGQRMWEPPCNLSNTDSWPLWPFENSGSRTLDTDHNRLHDVLFTSDNSYSLWMLMPGGRYGREVPLPVLSDGTQAFSFEDPGARIADVNGDRISDLAWIQSTRVVYWASCGRGNFDGPIFLPLSGSLQTAEIARSEFADVNGDALADLLVVRPAASPNGVHYRLNRGLAGFDSRRTILGLPAVQTGDATRRADMNGNGSVDLLISNSARAAGTREQFLDFVPDTRPHLLRQIDNGLGLVTTLDYETSVQQMVRAAGAGQPWSTTMPVSVPVVARITENDGRGNSFVREFTYRDPHFDTAKQEFRGFTRAEQRELGDASAPTKVTQYTFDPGVAAGCRKGMVLSEEVTDTAGGPFQRSDNTPQHRILDTGADGREVCFAFSEAVDVQVIERTGQPVHLRTEYEYDDFGNVLHENKHGVVDQVGDERFVETEYLYQLDRWLLDRVSRSIIRDAKGAVAAEDRFFYDPRGNLLENHRWLSTEDRFIVARRNEYDSFGNVVRVIDANEHARSVAYDLLMHTYPVSETVHLQSMDLTAAADYDMVLGATVLSVDFAGAAANYQYDALGRLTVLDRPNGARTTYQYDLGNPLSHVATRVRETTESEGTFDSHSYFDAYGRKLGTKVEAEDGQWRFTDAVTFNGRKLETARWLPFLTATPDYESPDSQLPHHTMIYDAQGRSVQTVNPDGSTTQTVFEPLLQHQHDENDVAGAATPKTMRRDGLDRWVEVIERNGPGVEYQTRYAWDTLDNLTEVLDAQGNRKSMAYDSLKRCTSLNDPDRGVVSYEYDDAGNLLHTTDARGQQIFYSYDFANRLVSENYIDQGGGPADPVDVRYVYDVPSENVESGDGDSMTAAFTGGRLSAVLDLSGEEHRSYDARGNVVWMVKRIRDPLLGVPASYRTGFAYDAMDRIAAIEYPDNDRCLYFYNTASFLESAGGGLGGQMVISEAAYEPTGQVSSLVFGNGAVTAYAYDDRDRLAELRTVSPQAVDMMRYSYLYDPASNITRIDDLRPEEGSGSVPPDSLRRNTQLFAYDELYRLTQVRYSPTGDGVPTHGQIDYAYDAIGNMLSQSTPLPGQTGNIADPVVNLGTMASGGSAGTANRLGRLPGDPPGPHAITATQSGGLYDYDDNGNLTEADGATLTWDFKDRLSRFQEGKTDARYTYDYTGRRIAKLVTEGNKTDQTLYINANFEVRPNRAPTKYVFAGPTRLAQVSGTLDPSRPRVQRMWLFEGFNLLTIAVQSVQTADELFGAGSRVYEWTGVEYREVAPGESVPVGTPLWVQVAAPRIAVARGPYTPTTEPVAIPAGQTLLAWPRLEPLLPQEHLSIDVRLQLHDAERPQWFLRDPLLPLGVADAIEAFPAASALWLTASGPNMLLPAAADNRSIVFYHGDHLGSANILTDRQGALLQESAYYPFGAVRNTHTSGSLFRGPYGFTQKEQDEESALHYFEARYLTGMLGRFVSPDPKFSNPAMLSSDDLGEYMAQPQKGNLYSYVLNNPLGHVDPTGLDEDADVAASVLEGLGQVSEKTGVIFEIVEDARADNLVKATGISKDAAKTITGFKSTPKINGVSTGIGIALNAKEAYDFVKDPTLEKGAHLGGTTAITVGGFVSGPGAMIAGAAQYTYDNTPQIHDAANKAGDWAAKLPGGSRASGGVVAAEVSVGLTIAKIAVGSTGGQGAAELFDAGLAWLAGDD